MRIFTIIALAIAIVFTGTEADGRANRYTYVNAHITGPGDIAWVRVPENGRVVHVDAMAQCLSGGVADFYPSYLPPGVPAIDANQPADRTIPFTLDNKFGDVFREDLDDLLLPFGVDVVGNNRVKVDGILQVTADNDQDVPSCGTTITFTIREGK